MKTDNSHVAPSPPFVRIIDTTLRDGEQAPGVVFSYEDKLKIADLLMAAGVDEIEVGIPAMGNAERRTIRAISKHIGKTPLTSWCRATTSDLELAEDCETDGAHVSFPASSILLRTTGKNTDWIERQMEMLLPMAALRFERISVGFQDVFRTGRSLLISFIRRALDCGAQRIRLADTVGLGTPNTVSALIHEIISSLGEIPLEFHGHNDLGMATANTLSAIEAGASAASVTVNGLGERAGNTALEELAVALMFGAGIPSNIRLDQLPFLCETVARLTGIPIPVRKPITGHNAFIHESGLHCHALLRDPSSYQPFLPEKIGRKAASFIIGKHSGKSAVLHILSQKGIRISDSEAGALLEDVRKAAEEKKASLSSEELISIYEKTASCTFSTYP